MNLANRYTGEKIVVEAYEPTDSIGSYTVFIYVDNGDYEPESIVWIPNAKVVRGENDSFVLIEAIGGTYTHTVPRAEIPLYINWDWIEPELLENDFSFWVLS